MMDKVFLFFNISPMDENVETLTYCGRIQRDRYRRVSKHLVLNASELQAKTAVVDDDFLSKTYIVACRGAVERAHAVALLDQQEASGTVMCGATPELVCVVLRRIELQGKLQQEIAQKKQQLSMTRVSTDPTRKKKTLSWKIWVQHRKRVVRVG